MDCGLGGGCYNNWIDILASSTSKPNHDERCMQMESRGNGVAESWIVIPSTIHNCNYKPGGGDEIAINISPSRDGVAKS